MENPILLNDPIDIWMVTYQRKELTKKAINYLHERTEYPYRLFVIDNNSTDGTQDLLRELEEEKKIFLSLNFSRNVGIHMAQNIGLSLVESNYCISTDNDIYVPDLKERDGKCWLTQMVELIDSKKYKDFAAVAVQPHVFLGATSPKSSDDVAAVNMCGSVMRMMRTQIIRKVGGWDRNFDANRNHEEKTICSRIQSYGMKVGYTTKIKAYHDFGDDNNWGYKEIHPHEHGHRIPGDEIWPTPEKFKDQEHLFNKKTWESKK